MNAWSCTWHAWAGVEKPLILLGADRAWGTAQKRKCTLKRTTKKVLSFCLCGMGLLFWGAAAFLWFVWPNLMMVQQPLVSFSGEHCSAEFACVSPTCAAFELCAEDEAYVPEMTGTVRLFCQGVLLHEFNICGFHVANGFRGSEIVGKKRYRMELQSADARSLEDLVKSNQTYGVECHFSAPVPKASMLYTCVRFQRLRGLD